LCHSHPLPLETTSKLLAIHFGGLISRLPQGLRSIRMASEILFHVQADYAIQADGAAHGDLFTACLSV
jgi:hypothetical protein